MYISRMVSHTHCVHCNRRRPSRLKCFALSMCAHSCALMLNNICYESCECSKNEFCILTIRQNPIGYIKMQAGICNIHSYIFTFWQVKDMSFVSIMPNSMLWYRYIEGHACSCNKYFFNFGLDPPKRWDVSRVHVIILLRIVRPSLFVACTGISATIEASTCWPMSYSLCSVSTVVSHCLRCSSLCH